MCKKVLLIIILDVSVYGLALFLGCGEEKLDGSNSVHFMVRSHGSQGQDTNPKVTPFPQIRSPQLCINSHMSTTSQQAIKL